MILDVVEHGLAFAAGQVGEEIIAEQVELVPETGIAVLETGRPIE